MKKRFIQRQIALAVVGGCLFAPFSMHSALAADEEVYDSGAVDIYAAKDAEPAPSVEEKAAPEAPSVEPVAEPEQPAENAYAGGQVARNVDFGILGDKPALDAPFSITGYTEQTIENKQVTQVADLIANDPSISNQTLSGVSSAWNIRGFKAQQQDVQLNGLYGVAPRFYGGIEGVERVDVLKGPSVLLAGIAPNGSLGGTINYVTKRADSRMACAIRRWSTSTTISSCRMPWAMLRCSTITTIRSTKRIPAKLACAAKSLRVTGSMS